MYASVVGVLAVIVPLAWQIRPPPHALSALAECGLNSSPHLSEAALFWLSRSRFPLLLHNGILRGNFVFAQLLQGGVVSGNVGCSSALRGGVTLRLGGLSFHCCRSCTSLRCSFCGCNRLES